MRLSQLRGASRLCSSFLASCALVLLSAQASAVPVLTLQSDVGHLFVEGRFEGNPGIWSDSYDGPVWGGVERFIEPSVEDEFGRFNSVDVMARVGEPEHKSGSSIGSFAVIDPLGSNSLPHHARADVEVTWRFVVGAESATFFANASGLGVDAQAGFTLYDETDDVLLASLDEGPGAGTSGTMAAGHEFTMNFFSHVSTPGDGDPFGSFAFYTNATIVPEPATIALLVLAAGAVGRRRFG